MNTNAELMASLQLAMAEISSAQSDDELAHIKLAMGQALYEYLSNGYCLTDLDWFKGTPYYTGAYPDNASINQFPKAA